MENKIEVLDKGYVRLVDYMGSDVGIINAARVSFDKETSLDPEGNFKEKDRRLMRFLWDRRETSVFRQATVQFEMYMPLMTARQYWKYIVAVANTGDGICMNESSRRYITEEPTFYIPNFTEWRGTPEDKKQGSGEPIDPRIGKVASKQLLDYVDQGLELYNYWLSIGIAPEQARLFLPAYGMYIRMRTTMSLAALLHFLDERLEHKAQHEIFVYARAMRGLVEPLFPEVFDAVFGELNE